MAESISGADVFRDNWFYNKKEELLVLMTAYDNIVAAVDIWSEEDCFAKGF